MGNNTLTLKKPKVVEPVKKEPPKPKASHYSEYLNEVCNIITSDGQTYQEEVISEDLYTIKTDIGATYHKSHIVKIVKA